VGAYKKKEKIKRGVGMKRSKKTRKIGRVKNQRTRKTKPKWWGRKNKKKGGDFH
jgi:hypothetical protein